MASSIFLQLQDMLKILLYVYSLLKTLYSMPTAARACHTIMSAFLAKEGCATAGLEKNMWTVTIDGACILPRAHIDDFVIVCANQQVLAGFCARLLDAFEGTYERALRHYLGGDTQHGQRYYVSVPDPLRREKFCALTISGMPLLTLYPCSPTRASIKTTVARILPQISIEIIVVLLAA